MKTLAGPVFGTEVPAPARLTVGNLQELVTKGEAKNAGRELVTFARRFTPGRSLFYSSLALERLVFDELQIMLDPKAMLSFRRIEQRAKRDRRQNFFSRPGRGFPPQRLPDLAAAFGQ